MNIDYIIDANVVFSALLSGKVIYKTLLSRYHCFSSDYLFAELDRHKDIILTKSKLDSTQLLTYSLSIFSQIGIVPAMFLSEKAKQEAFKLCEKVDMNDFLYVALAIDFDKPLITRDETLLEGLRRQKFKNAILLQDVFDTL